MHALGVSASPDDMLPAVVADLPAAESREQELERHRLYLDANRGRCPARWLERYDSLARQVADEVGVQIRFRVRDGKPWVYRGPNGASVHGHLYPTAAGGVGAMRARSLEESKLLEQWKKDVFNQAYAQVMVDLAPDIAMLQQALVKIALEPGADVKQQRLAAQVAKDVLDRLGGRATQQIDVTKTSTESLTVRMAHLDDAGES